jgi:UDP-N-acetyl-D-mannosaminuronic acid transferase (WecB/TagA/CpsF family)
MDMETKNGRPAAAAVDLMKDRDFRRILGISFFVGTVSEAVSRMKRGGLLVVPSAPVLKDMTTNVGCREALLNADLVITDSAFMVLLWNWMESDSILRVSGLEYIRELLRQPEIRREHKTFWIMASKASAERNVQWLRTQGINVGHEDMYIAPLYGNGGHSISDAVLLEQIRKTRPEHIIVTLGGGTQERLGLYLKRNLDYLPSIHCIGAAIGFLSGDQVRIPTWADKFYLGWLCRCISDPGTYIPRYWGGRKLLPLLLKYRSRLPVPKTPP